MTEEDEEFNRIERESMMRMKAVEAVVTRGGSRVTIEMAREAAGDDWGLFREYMPEIHRLVELVRADERARMAEQPAQQEPVAYLCENAVGHQYFRWKKPSSEYKPIALYTSPPAQRTWVGLTDADKQEAFDETQEASGGFWEFADYLEAKLKEKNT